MRKASLSLWNNTSKISSSCKKSYNLGKGLWMCLSPKATSPFLVAEWIPLKVQGTLLHSECRENWGLLAEGLVLEAPKWPNQCLASTPGSKGDVVKQVSLIQSLLLQILSWLGLFLRRRIPWTGPPLWPLHLDKSHHTLTEVFIHSLSWHAAWHKGSSLPQLPLLQHPLKHRTAHYQAGLQPFPPADSQPQKQPWVPSELAPRSTLLLQ